MRDIWKDLEGKGEKGNDVNIISKIEEKGK